MFDFPNSFTPHSMLHRLPPVLFAILVAVFGWLAPVDAESTASERATPSTGDVFDLFTAPVAQVPYALCAGPEEVPVPSPRDPQLRNAHGSDQLALRATRSAACKLQALARGALGRWVDPSPLRNRGIHVFLHLLQQ